MELDRRSRSYLRRLDAVTPPQNALLHQLPVVAGVVNVFRC